MVVDGFVFHFEGVQAALHSIPPCQIRSVTLWNTLLPLLLLPTMNVNKKLDRFKQWAGERMGGEVKTNVSDDFKALEVEMGLRHEGKLTRSTCHT